MKKNISVLLAIALMLGAMSVAVSAASSVTLYVSIAVNSGELVCARSEVTVTDSDSDGKLTVNDALYCAHKQLYSNGAAGYATAMGDYGIYITKLWGESNGTGFGYYLNNSSVWSLTDTVKANDHVYAFVYTDTQNFSDMYSFFETDTVEATAYKPFDVTLYCLKYDASWNLVKTPVKGAEIKIDGRSTSYITDENGKASVTVAKTGEHRISASSDSLIITPPVCVATFSANANLLDAVIYYINSLINSLASLFNFLKLITAIIPPLI